MDGSAGKERWGREREFISPYCLARILRSDSTARAKRSRLYPVRAAVGVIASGGQSGQRARELGSTGMGKVATRFAILSRANLRFSC